MDTGHEGACVPGRELLRDRRGRSIADFVPGISSRGRPWADDVRVLDESEERVAEALLGRFAGWIVSTSVPSLGGILLARATPLRHFHVYAWDLAAQLPDPDWSPTLPGWIRFTGVGGVRAVDLEPPRRLAYPSGHVDHADGQFERLVGLLRGSLYGPVLNCSRVAVCGTEVIAAVLVTGETGMPALPVPGIVDVFRDPRISFPGLGAMLVRCTLAQARTDGRPSRLLLTVTDGNPARRIYESIGFRYLKSARSVMLPGVPAVEPLRVERL